MNKERFIKIIIYYLEKLLGIISRDVKLLRFLPPYTPEKKQLQQWSLSSDADYQLWINKNSSFSVDLWIQHHLHARRCISNNKISIITPVYNPERFIFQECIASVQLQTSPYWEWILVDDGTHSQQIKKILKSNFFYDPRIKVIHSTSVQAQGISKTTNIGIHAATGNYIVFLDHDDRLTLNAVELLLLTIAEKKYDIIYSDRDMINPGNFRENHLMKPDWSPDTLLSGNYIFHLMCYKKKFLNRIGLLRSEYDGSQDYDLVLRASEHNPSVKHLSTVLYQWRQHKNSIAQDASAKDYTFVAGIKALQASLKRRHIVAKVTENPIMWRGNYQLDLAPVEKDLLITVGIDKGSKLSYWEQINTQLKNNHSANYLMILGNHIIAEKQQTLTKMAAWMQFSGIGMVTGKLLNDKKEILYSGIFYTQQGQLLPSYQGCSDTEFGYMGVTSITRNISIPNPYCVLIHRDLWQQLNGLNKQYKDTLCLLDFSFRARKKGWRIIYQAESLFSQQQQAENKNFYHISEEFKQQWQTVFSQGDPYYNPNLCQHCNDMRLKEIRNNDLQYER